MDFNAQQRSTPPDPSTGRALSEMERCELSAYNAAFEQLGFSWHWSDEDYRGLLEYPDAAVRIEHYIRERHPHLLSAYDPKALGALVEELKRDCEAGAPHDDRLQSFDPEFRPL